MHIGLQIPNFSWPGGAAALGNKLAQIARTADEAGFASLWVMDHFFQIDIVGPPETDMLEGYSTLAYVAALTTKLRLGTMVTGVTYRHPGILAKTAATLDVLSGGRAYLGIGAAWYEREHRGLGVPFPPLTERFARLEETLQIARQMWSPDNGPFRGEHYQLEGDALRPPTTEPTGIANSDRRAGRTKDVTAGRTVCRCVQFVRPHRCGGTGEQVARTARTLCRSRSRLRRDRVHEPRYGRTSRRKTELSPGDRTLPAARRSRYSTRHIQHA